MSLLRQEGVVLIQPTVFIPEMVASITRKQDSTDIALEILHELKKFPELTLTMTLQAKSLHIIACEVVMQCMP